MLVYRVLHAKIQTQRVALELLATLVHSDSSSGLHFRLERCAGLSAPPPPTIRQPRRRPFFMVDAVADQNWSTHRRWHSEVGTELYFRFILFILQLPCHLNHIMLITQNSGILPWTNVHNGLRSVIYYTYSTLRYHWLCPSINALALCNRNYRSH